jgi:hypothetical protein
MEEQRAEAVDVATRRCWRASENLWCEISWRPGDGRRAAFSILELHARSEVPEHDPPCRLDHHVLRFHVAMNETGAMDRIERAAQLRADPRDVLGRKGTAVAQLRFQGATLDELHPETGPAIEALSTVDRRHVRVTDARHQPPFFNDGGIGWTCVGIASPQELECDFPIETGVPRAIYVAEATMPERLDDPERAPRGGCVGRTLPARRKREIKSRERPAEGETRESNNPCARTEDQLWWFIVFASLTSARTTVILAASAEGFPSAWATSA